jgi:hypothetical protein
VSHRYSSQQTLKRGLIERDAGGKLALALTSRVRRAGRMKRSRTDRSVAPIDPMTLGNMRANGVRSLDVSGWLCHEITLDEVERIAEGYPESG